MPFQEAVIRAAQGAALASKALKISSMLSPTTAARVKKRNEAIVRRKEEAARQKKELQKEREERALKLIQTVQVYCYS